MEIYIVLGIMVFMIVGFLWGKWPLGLTAMTCCVLLALTKVMTIQEAFAGFVNRNLIVVAGMFVISTAFGKTSFVGRIQKKMSSMEGGKSSVALRVILLGLAILLAQFLPTTASLTVMMMFLTTLSADGDITPSRMLLPICGMVGLWTGKLPVGLGASYHLQINGFMETVGVPSDYMLTILDIGKVAIIPGILITIYTFFAYKWMPNKHINLTKLGKSDKGPAPISKHDDVIIYTVFFLVMAAMFMNDFLGDVMYLIPIVGILVLAYTKTLTIKEIVDPLTSDPVWMLSGLLVMGDALSKSGAGEFIGTSILKVLGDNPNGLFVMFVFCLVSVVMTAFLSNTATANVLIPIAATTALAANMDPRGLVIAIQICSTADVAFPTGSPATAIAYSTGGYNLVSTLKYSIPYLIIATISIALCAYAVFPVYP